MGARGFGARRDTSSRPSASITCFRGKGGMGGLQQKVVNRAGTAVATRQQKGLSTAAGTATAKSFYILRRQPTLGRVVRGGAEPLHTGEKGRLFPLLGRADDKRPSAHRKDPRRGGFSPSTSRFRFGGHNTHTHHPFIRRGKKTPTRAISAFTLLGVFSSATQRLGDKKKSNKIFLALLTYTVTGLSTATFLGLSPFSLLRRIMPSTCENLPPLARRMTPRLTHAFLPLVPSSSLTTTPLSRSPNCGLGVPDGGRWAARRRGLSGLSYVESNRMGLSGGCFDLVGSDRGLPSTLWWSEKVRSAARTTSHDVLYLNSGQPREATVSSSYDITTCRILEGYVYSCV